MKPFPIKSLFSMNRTVVVYKTDLRGTASDKFQRDSAKKQRDGWRLVSWTPNSPFTGFARKITATYER